MPQSGNVVMSAKEEDNHQSLFMFSLKDGKLKETNKLSSPCGHKAAAYVYSLIMNGGEQLVVCCVKCSDLKMVDFEMGVWNTGFPGCKLYRLCSGDNGTVFYQSRWDGSILKLDATCSVFKSLIRTLHPDMVCEAICYIPYPVNALVLSDAFSSNMVALSVERGVIIWEFQQEKGGVYHHKENAVYDRTGLLFHPELNVLFVADGIRQRVLAVNPSNGDLIQTIDLPELGEIWALGIYNN